MGDHDQLHKVVAMSSGHLGDIEIFNAAAHLRNHQIFFDTLTPWDYSNADEALSRNTRKEFYTQFGGLEGMKDQFVQKAKNFKGSGWLWLINRDSHWKLWKLITMLHLKYWMKELFQYLI